METKEVAQEYLNNAKEFMILTDECVLVDAKYPTIEKMIYTACQQPDLKMTIIRTIQNIIRMDALTMLN